MQTLVNANSASIRNQARMAVPQKNKSPHKTLTTQFKISHIQLNPFQSETLAAFETLLCVVVGAHDDKCSEGLLSVSHVLSQT